MGWHYVVRQARHFGEPNPDPFVYVRGRRTTGVWYRLGELLQANTNGFRLRLGDVLVLPHVSPMLVSAIGREGARLVVDIR